MDGHHYWTCAKRYLISSETDLPSKRHKSNKDESECMLAYHVEIPQTKEEDPPDRVSPPDEMLRPWRRELPPDFQVERTAADAYFKFAVLRCWRANKPVLVAFSGVSQACAGGACAILLCSPPIRSSDGPVMEAIRPYSCASPARAGGDCTI